MPADVLGQIEPAGLRIPELVHAVLPLAHVLPRSLPGALKAPPSLVAPPSLLSPVGAAPVSSLTFALYGRRQLVRLCGGGCAYQATHCEHEVQIEGRRQREVRCDA